MKKQSKKNQTDSKEEIKQHIFYPSQGFLDLLTNLTFDLIFRVRLEPTLSVDYVSRSIEGITGYSLDEIYADPYGMIDRIHPDDRGTILFNLFNKLYVKGPSEVRFINKDGSVVWLELHPIPIYGDDGRLIAQEGIARVITDRKKTEEQLRESKEHLEAIINNTPVGIFMADLDGKCIAANSSLMEMFGVERDEIINRNLFDFIYGRDLIKNLDKYRDLVNGKEKNYKTEIRLKKTNGALIWIEVSVTSVYNEKQLPAAFIGVITDISERKKYEAQLHAHKESLEKKVRQRTFELLLALEKNKTEIKERKKADKRLETRLHYESGLADFTQSLLLADMDSSRALSQSLGHLLKASDSSRIYIFKNYEDPVDGLCMRLVEEVCDKHFQPQLENPKLKHIPYDKGFAHWREVMSKQAPLVRTVTSCNKEEKYLLKLSNIQSLLALPIWAENKWYGFIGFSSSRKDHWWKEEDVRLLRTAAAVIGAFQERKEMEAEVLRRQKLESLGLLAAGIAHDFNNFLSGILLSSSIAKKTVDPDNPAYEILCDAEEAAKRASNLSNQLITFTKGGAPQKSITTVSKLLKESAVFALTGSKCNCDFQILDDLWPANIDRGKITQVIHNLMLNAVQAMSQGGKIVVKAENVKLNNKNEMLLKTGKYVKISITDRGIGIAQENIGKIFDPYYTTKGTGFGLGLTVSYAIIKNHEGYLGVDSTVGYGSTFYFYLPAVSEAMADAADEREILLKGTGKVLIMDDEELVVIAISKGLKMLGYDVEISHNGEEAIELYMKSIEKSEKYDAVILDLTIAGGMSGIETAERILKIDGDAKLIVSSGYSNDRLLTDYDKYGFSARLVKPYTVSNLSEVLSSIIEKRKRRKKA